MADRGGRKAHRAVDHDGAGAAVDDHPRGGFRRGDFDHLDRGHLPGARIRARRQGERDGHAIFDHRGAGQPPVDRIAHPRGGEKVGGKQVVAQDRRIFEPRGDRAFDARAFGNASDGGDIDRELRPIARRNTQPADRQAALRHRVDLAVGAVQRRQDQRPATQGLGLADGRDGDVDPLAGFGERGQVGGDHHRRGVLEARRDARRQLHAQPARNPAHGLGQVFEIVIAGAAQPDDDAVAGQLVRADALERAEVAHALGVGGAGHGQQGEQRKDELMHRVGLKTD